MKSTAGLRHYTGPDLVICAEWKHQYFPEQKELIEIINSQQEPLSFDYSRCITTSVLFDKDNHYIYYDLCTPGRYRADEYAIQDPEFYHWHKVKAYIRSDTRDGFHPNEITTEEGQRKVIRRYFTENCLLIAKRHFGSIRGLHHYINDQADGSFLMNIEYQAKFEGAFKGFFE